MWSEKSLVVDPRGPQDEEELERRMHEAYGGFGRKYHWLLSDKMKRMHLFEFEDQPWFPGFIRDGMTDYLKYVVNRFDFYKSIVPVLQKGLRASGGDSIIDLASGSGGGWPKLSAALLESFPALRVTLTDRFPNQRGCRDVVQSNPSVFAFEPTSVDARDVPSHLSGLRTQFLSFHHFRPQAARQILQNAVDAGQPIAVLEAQKRDLAHLAKFALSPIAVLMLTPCIRPVRWHRLVFTYLLPAIPLFTFWDGLISVLRTYSTAEMSEMVDALSGADCYDWEVGEVKSGSVCVLFLLGTVRKTTIETSQ